VKTCSLAHHVFLYLAICCSLYGDGVGPRWVGYGLGWVSVDELDPETTLGSIDAILLVTRMHALECTRSHIIKQEAQLLLGDRATRKHAKDSLNGRGNDNLG